MLSGKKMNLSLHITGTVTVRFGPETWLAALDLMRMLRAHGIGVWAEPDPGAPPVLSEEGLLAFRDVPGGTALFHEVTDTPLPQQFEAVYKRVHVQDMAGRDLLVTAGPTVEDIDPVRFLTNRSSGRMGLALAAAAARRGARVCLVHGPVRVPVPPVDTLEAVPVRSARQMHDAVMARIHGVQIAVLCAAVADFTPAQPAAQKIKKTDREGGMPLALERTPDILAALGRLHPRPLLVGFAAESENVLEHAREKLRRKGCDILCANDISRDDRGFDSERNEVTLLYRDGTVTALPLQGKETLAHGILDAILRAAAAPGNARGG